LNDDQVSRKVADLAGDQSELQWVIEGVLPAASLIMLAGEPKKARKTLTAMRLGLDVAQGLPFLGTMKTHSRRVVYTFLEDGMKRGARRFRHLGVDPILHENVAMAATFGAASYWSIHERISTTEDPIVWVIDPLAELMVHNKVSDENNANEVTNFLRPLRELCQSKGHTIILVHHFRKAGDRARGSSALEAAVDGWWSLKPGRAVAGGHHPVNANVTLRDGDDCRFGIRFEVDKATGLIGMTHRAAKDDSDDDEVEEAKARKPSKKRQSTMEVAGKIRALLIQQPEQVWTQGRLADEIGCSVPTVGNAIAELRSTGNIEEPEGAWGYRYKIR